MRPERSGLTATSIICCSRKLSPAQLSAVLSALRIAPGAEVTIECNPDTLSLEKLAGYRAAGVNRVSLGVQSFDPRVLLWMHRTHTAEQVPAAVWVLRAEGFASAGIADPTRYVG